MTTDRPSPPGIFATSEAIDLPPGFSFQPFAGHTVQFKYTAGDKVRLIGIDVPGTVLSALIDSEGRQYRVVWWWDGTRRSEWLHEFEIEPAVESQR